MGIGPKFVKVGRRVLDPRETMLAYFREHTYQASHEATDE
jgi:hypothetical protein